MRSCNCGRAGCERRQRERGGGERREEGRGGTHLVALALDAHPLEVLAQPREPARAEEAHLVHLCDDAALLCRRALGVEPVDVDRARAIHVERGGLARADAVVAEVEQVVERAREGRVRLARRCASGCLRAGGGPALPAALEVPALPLLKVDVLGRSALVVVVVAVVVGGCGAEEAGGGTRRGAGGGGALEAGEGVVALLLLAVLLRDVVRVGGRVEVEVGAAHGGEEGSAGLSRGGRRARAR